MKELSTEEKAKRYDEVIKKAETLYKAAEPMSGCNVIIETLFPELKESEDERIKRLIKNSLKAYFEGNLAIGTNDTDYAECLAWLEQQCEQNPYGQRKESEDERMLREIKSYIKEQGDKPTGLPNGTAAVADMIAWLEKQGEQKPEGKTALEAAKEEKADNQNCVKPTKVEPKFKVGDWLVHKEMVGVTCCITQIHAPYYLTTNNSFIKFGEEDNYRLWTIEDAKDGDVLHCWIDGDEFVLIYKGIRDGYITANGHLYQKFKSFSEEPTSMFCRTIQGHFTPATKEQRDLLFQKMKEAGYEFDFDKLELKKIEQNPAWSEEDEKNLRVVVDYLIAYNGLTLKHINWLKSLKDRVLPKQEWSEVDEERLSDAIFFVREYQIPTRDKRLLNAAKETEDWLKSLRHQPKQEILEKLEEWLDEYVSDLADVDTASLIGSFTNYLDGKLPVKPKNRWKPSDEQLMYLCEAIDVVEKAEEFSIKTALKELREQLMKLREE